MAQLKDTNVDNLFMINNTNIFSLIYPVGSIYMSVKNTNPSSLFGGTWVAWGAGRVPVGMGSNGTTNYSTVESTGGAESRSHSHTSATSGPTSTSTGGNSGTTGSTTLTLSQIPSHTHSLSKDLIEVSQVNSNTMGLQVGSTAYQGRIMLRKGALGEDVTVVSANASGGGSGHTHSLNGHIHTVNSHTHSIPASNSVSIDTRPPYVTCYMWKRTA